MYGKKSPYPANIYLFKVNNINTRKRCEIYSKLTIKTPERRQRPVNGQVNVSWVLQESEKLNHT